MYNTREHRFARLIDSYETGLNGTAPVPVSAPVPVTAPVPVSAGSTEGVFHFGASGPRTENAPKRKVRKPRRKRANPSSPREFSKPPSTCCSICMETIQGNVTLKCGHEMCPACYAMHSRVNNTCPYCREVFAPEVKKAASLRMPIDEAESLIDDNAREYYHEDVKEELLAILKENEQLSESQINDIELTVYCHIYQASMNTYHIIDEWFDDNEG